MAAILLALKAPRRVRRERTSPEHSLGCPASSAVFPSTAPLPPAQSAGGCRPQQPVVRQQDSQVQAAQQTRSEQPRRPQLPEHSPPQPTYLPKAHSSLSQSSSGGHGHQSTAPPLSTLPPPPSPYTTYHLASPAKQVTRGVATKSSAGTCKCVGP